MKSIGCSGMSLWRILVLGLLRQVISADYDRVCNLANNHAELRRFLGHGMIDRNDRYSLQSIKDKVSLLSDDALNEINTVMVQLGHGMLDSRLTKQLNIKTDRFVVKSNVHYPTDTSLLFDAMKFLINLVGSLANKHEIPGWREYKYCIRKIKTLKRKASNLRRSTSKKDGVTIKHEQLIEETHKELITLCQSALSRLDSTIVLLKKEDLIKDKQVAVFDEFKAHANRQIDQINRRIILKEIIPHSEKVFSLFNPFTEWVSKGKAGVPVELGLKVSISTDQHSFILAHRIMEQEQDVDVAIPIITKLKESFPNIYSASFDRGYYSPANKRELNSIVSKLILPKKGKVSQKDRDKIQRDHEYRKLRKKHSAVESNINALEHHALDHCPDRSIESFKKYVSMSILAHNIHQIGTLVQRKIQKQNNHKDPESKIAA